MLNWIKSVLITIACLIPGAIVISLVEMLSQKLFPQPENISFQEYLKHLPLMAMLLVLVGMMLGAFTSGFAVTLLNKDNAKRSVLIIGILFTIVSLINLSEFPHPTWFWVANLGLMLPSAFFGSKIAQSFRPTPSNT